MKKRIICLLLCMCVVLTTFCFTELSVMATGGMCGENLTWNYDGNGTLTISGNGEMTNFPEPNSAPWYSLKRSIYRVVFDNAVTHIGDYAFNTHPYINEVILPTSLKSIGQRAFYGTAISNIQFPEELEKIGNQAFYLCKSLTEVNLPSGLKVIDEMAFQNCYSLSEVSFPCNLERIGRQAFYGCALLYNINIPKSVTYVGYGAFKKTDYYNDPQNIVDGFFYVGDCLMSNEEGICESYNVKEGTRLIAEEAFSYGRINSIFIPSSVEYIGSRAIGSRYNKVTVDGNNKKYCSVDGSLFSKDKTVLIHYNYTDDVKTFNVPEGVKSIEESAFEDCDLERITLPQSLEKIGNEAFYFTQISQINIPANVKTIGERVFSSCFELSKITTDEDSLYFVADDGVLFEKATKRLVYYPYAKTSKSYVIPDGVKTIDAYSFWGNGYLRRLVMPKTMEHIGEDAFFNCGVEEIVMQKGPKVISYGSFRNCAVKSFIVPEGVTTIDAYAFAECSNLSSITIPKTVTFIDDYAFYQCFSLKNVYYTGTEEEWSKITVGNYNSAITNKDKQQYNSPNPYVKCTVKFNVNGGEGNYEPIQVVVGTFVPAPVAPTKSEYVFTGWYANRACTGIPYISASGVANRTVTDDITLYAGWKKTEIITWGVDTLNFANTEYCFGGDYYISDEYYHLLTKNLDYDNKVAMDIQRYQDFGGSCYGMTEVMSLMKLGQLDPGFFHIGAKTPFGLPIPKLGTKKVASLMNYYYLSQFLPEVEELAKQQQKLGNSALAKKLVSALEDIEKTGIPVVVNFYLKDDPNQKGWAGHSILAYKVEDDGTKYVVHIADPNCLVRTIGIDPVLGGPIFEVATPTYMNISYDFKTVYYTGGDIIDISTENNTFKFHSVWTDTTAYGFLNIQEKLSQNKYNAPAELTSLSNETEITVNYPEFELANGESVSKICDDTYEGDLEIADSYATLNTGRWIHTLSVEEAYTVIPETNMDLYTTNITYNSQNSFIYAESTQKPLIKASPEGVGEIISNEPGYKALTISANSESFPWNSITVSAENVKTLKAQIGNYGVITFSSESSLNGAKVIANGQLGNTEIVFQGNDTAFSIINESDYNGEYITLQGSGAAQKESIVYKMVFYSMGGTETESILNLSFGDVVNKPEDPTKEGFIFDGWYKDDTYTQKWDFDYDIIEEDTILYAKWNQNPDYYCLLTVKDSAETQQVVLRKDEIVSLMDFSANIEKDGYVLLGWSENRNAQYAEYRIDDSYILNDDATLYPVWKNTPCTISSVKEMNDELIVKTNLYEVPASATIIVAGYENKKLVSVSKAVCSDYEGSFKLPAIVDEVKVFVVNSLVEMKPLANVEVIPNVLFNKVQ